MESPTGMCIIAVKKLIVKKRNHWSIKNARETHIPDGYSRDICGTRNRTGIKVSKVSGQIRLDEMKPNITREGIHTPPTCRCSG